jgi:hypothetical protein
MADTVRMLGTRLKDVLAEAEVAREKVRRRRADPLSGPQHLTEQHTSSSLLRR